MKIEEDHDLRYRRFARVHQTESGELRGDLIDAARKRVIALPFSSSGSRKQSVTARTRAAQSDGVWKSIGPSNSKDPRGLIGDNGPFTGMVTGIAIDPSDPGDKTIYIATVAGGIWKTTDGGNQWRALTDQMPSLYTSCITLDPVNPAIVYVGTAEGGISTFFPLVPSIGIYRSIDGGNTWRQPSQNFPSIACMVAPKANRLLVGSKSGLYLSINSGSTFGANAPQFDDGLAILEGNISDLKVDTESQDIIYVCINGQGVFVSADCGETFGTNLFDGKDNIPKPGFTDLKFSQSTKPDAKTFYVSVAKTFETYEGLFISKDRGKAWERARARSDYLPTESQFTYNHVLAVDPRNAKRVLLGFNSLHLSTDSAKNFSIADTPGIGTQSVKNLVHGDYHSLAFGRAKDSNSLTPIYAGTDGGLWVSFDGTKTWECRNKGISTMLFYDLDMGRGSPANHQYMYGGLQDNGSVVRSGDDDEGVWRHCQGGDGRLVAVDPMDPQRAYFSPYFSGVLMMTSDGGATIDVPLAATTNLPPIIRDPPLASPSSFGIVLAVDMNDNSVVYLMSNDGANIGTALYRSIDRGVTYQILHLFQSSITAFAVANSNSKVALVGCSGGEVFKCNDISQRRDSQQWDDLTGKLLSASAPRLSVGGAVFDPDDSNIAVVAFLGYTEVDVTSGAMTRHVFRTVDAGQTWADIGGTEDQPGSNFPDTPCHAVIIDRNVEPRSILVAAVGGVLRTDDNGASWHRLGRELPAVDCSALVCDVNTNPLVLRVATWGRGVFELERPATGRISVASNLALSCQGPGAIARGTFEVVNVGFAPLTISSIVDKKSSSHFTLDLSVGLPLTLDPGESRNIAVAFEQALAGTYATEFEIVSDDPNHPSVFIPASGEVTNLSDLPIIESVFPVQGQAAGGVTITIFGSNFNGVLTVEIGERSIRFNVVSDTEISVPSTPPGQGTVKVRVTNRHGTSAADYIYTGTVPFIKSITPSQGSENGGGGDNAVTIEFVGIDPELENVTSVTFGGVPDLARMRVSNTKLLVAPPPGKGSVPVRFFTPNGLVPAVPVPQYRYLPKAANQAQPSVGVGNTGNPVASPADRAEGEILSVMADILRNSNDPEILAAQRILMRRIAMGGDVVPSRIPAPKNITEVGGYVNLLGSLSLGDIRTEMLASTLGVASGRESVFGSLSGPPIAFIAIENDRPTGPAQRVAAPRVSIRSDFVDDLQDALTALRLAGCQLPLRNLARGLPQRSPSSRRGNIDALALLGRAIQIVDEAWLIDAATDPIVAAMVPGAPLNSTELYCRGAAPIATDNVLAWLALQADGRTIVALEKKELNLIAITPYLSAAGWYCATPAVPPSSLQNRGTLGRWTNITDLTTGKTTLRDELSQLYRADEVAASLVADRLSWVWDGSDFVPID